MQTCRIANAKDVQEEYEQEAVYNSWGDNITEAIEYIEARFTCDCGKYQDMRLRHQGSIGEIIRGVARGI